MKFNCKEDIIQLTPLWTGERFEDGRPKVPDEILERIKKTTIEEMWAPLVRLGYNYQTPTYREDGFKDSSLGTEGSYYSSATDYTNWKATNRITAGLGYAIGNLNLDVAYQYSCTNGDFYPFMSYRDNDYAADDNIASAVKVSNKRHQLLFTIGYRF